VIVLALDLTSGHFPWPARERVIQRVPGVSPRRSGRRRCSSTGSSSPTSPCADLPVREPGPTHRPGRAPPARRRPPGAPG